MHDRTSMTGSTVHEEFAGLNDRSFPWAEARSVFSWSLRVFYKLYRRESGQASGKTGAGSGAGMAGKPGNGF